MFGAPARAPHVELLFSCHGTCARAAARTWMEPSPGFEPGLGGSEPHVLPLNEPGELRCLVPSEGVEPTTNRLRAGCSAIELRRQRAIGPSCVLCVSQTDHGCSRAGVRDDVVNGPGGAPRNRTWPVRERTTDLQSAPDPYRSRTPKREGATVVSQGGSVRRVTERSASDRGSPGRNRYRAPQRRGNRLLLASSSSSSQDVYRSGSLAYGVVTRPERAFKNKFRQYSWLDRARQTRPAATVQSLAARS